jgi:hypothetical protein
MTDALSDAGRIATTLVEPRWKPASYRPVGREEAEPLAPHHWFLMLE